MGNSFPERSDSESIQITFWIWTNKNVVGVVNTKIIIYRVLIARGKSRSLYSIEILLVHNSYVIAYMKTLRE